MVDLFVRTASQALQAFVPVAFGLLTLRRSNQARAIAAARWGLLVAAIATIPAGLLLQRTAYQARWEAGLALLALATTAWLLRRMTRHRALPSLMIAGTTLLLVTRQTMEIGAVFTVAAFQVRSAAPVLAIVAATLLTLGAVGAWMAIGRRLSTRAFNTAAAVFAVLFVGQLALYAFHESAEARLLPWSDVLHAATEPYGPDGEYGRYFAWLLIALPLIAAVVVTLRARRASQPSAHPHAPGTQRVVLATLCVVAALTSGFSLRSAETGAAQPTSEGVAMADRPHLLFRHTLIDQEYGKLSIAALADPAGRRVSLGLSCDRVAFADGRGLCLQAQRGVFTKYRAIMFDRQFKTLASWELAGNPSRARVASDGRVGAITVFVAGHSYASPFSTKTTLIDMASGDTLGDLEQFSTWRDGARFTGQDFNFWGVTFGRDSSRFYATLGTGGRTFLVRGDLALRKLTVLREGVECPSLSPDEKHIAFKKREGPRSGLWRAYVLDLPSLDEHPIAGETRNIDDQMEWLDTSHVLYSVPREASATTDVWIAPIDGGGPARVLAPAAQSPSVVR